jgi:hypothetical protein
MAAALKDADAFFASTARGMRPPRAAALGAKVSVSRVRADLNRLLSE